MYFKIILCLIVILVTHHPISNALNVEALIYGIPSDSQEPQYVVLIVGQRNYSTSYHFLCNAAVLSKFYVISIAPCLLDTDGQLRRFTFRVNAGTTSLNMASGIERSVDDIYFSTTVATDADNHVAMLKVGWAFRLGVWVKALQLPRPNELFGGIGQIFTYTHEWSMIEDDEYTHFELNGLQSEFVSLNYGFVKIMSTGECLAVYPLASDETDVCGVLMPVDIGMSRNTFLFQGDSGSPLMKGIEIVGLANKIVINKNSQILPDKYLKISKFVPFIRAVMEGSPPSGTVHLKNRPHELVRQAPTVHWTIIST